MTTAGIYTRLFPGCSVRRAYKRLLVLKKAGFIRYKNLSDTRGFVWALTKKGYASVRPKLPSLKEDGFRCEFLEHDLLTAFVQLGPRALEDQEIPMVTEQELRRFDACHYPTWIPRSTAHRSDGYWKSSSENPDTCVALEVELTLKKDTEYEGVALFYADFPGVTTVLWVVNKVTHAKKIRALLKASEPRAIAKHRFVLVEDLKLDGWDAKFLNGPEESGTLKRLLGKKMAQSWLNVATLSILDTRKFPYDLVTYETRKTASNLH